MTAEPVTVATDAPLIAVRVLMEQYGIDYLPVVEAGSVVGMVDRAQLDRDAVDLAVGASVDACRIAGSNQPDDDLRVHQRFVAAGDCAPAPSEIGRPSAPD